ncbi:MAG TPA: hypothetical protein VHJ39_18260 [Solirubrobacteraceae bacterium]|jgi:hypothetical protein|nr:hypothetical protein [Solirubrobacteraceae bacterium]
MHNRALHDSLAAFVEEAAWQLAEEVSGGAEVPFELVDASLSGRASAPLYCYRPLTDRFIAERSSELAKLPSYPAAVQGLAGLPDLPAYLQARGRRPPSPDRRQQADAVLHAFLTAVWADSSDFGFDRGRFDAAFAELEEASYGDRALSLVLAAVEGLVLENDEVPLSDGLSLARVEALGDVPAELRADEMATVAVLALDAEAGHGRALEDAGRRLRRLQTALRLWDDAEPSLGPTAWARTDGGTWSAVPLATGIRRDAGECLLAADEEDPLRAFCSLVTRRTPRGGELAWALRRFELGCERTFAVEALTDWLLAGRALLADEDSAGYDGLAERLAVICATPEERPALESRLEETIGLERAAIAGRVRPEPRVEDLIADLGGNLRAVLRDVLCGHLDPQLRRVADEMLDAERVGAGDDW